MKFTAAPMPAGRWAAGYLIPGTAILQALADCPTRDCALREAQALQARHDRENPNMPADPLERRIPAGFYTDDDAS